MFLIVLLRLYCIELFRLKILLRMLQVASFAGRMNALSEIRRVLQTSDLSARGIGDSRSSALSREEVAVWLLDQDLLAFALKDNMHQPQYVDRVEKVGKPALASFLICFS